MEGILVWSLQSFLELLKLKFEFAFIKDLKFNVNKKYFDFVSVVYWIPRYIKTFKSWIQSYQLMLLYLLHWCVDHREAGAIH